MASSSTTYKAPSADRIKSALRDIREFFHPGLTLDDVLDMLLVDIPLLDLDDPATLETVDLAVNCLFGDIFGCG